MKTVYLYDTITHQFTGTYDAPNDLVNEGEYIVPISSTDVEPPSIGGTPNVIQVFDVSTGTWTLVPDYRGAEWYDANGSKVKIMTIGQPDDTLSPTIPDHVLLLQAQSAVIQRLTGEYLAATQLPVSYMGTTFQADDASQQVLQKVLVAGSVASGFFWVDANNQRVPVTFKNLQGLASAMLVQGQAAFAHLQDLKDQVRACTTIDAINTIVW